MADIADSFAQGIQSGAQYAQAAQSAALQKETLTNQKAQLDLAKLETNAKVGKQLTDMMLDAATEPGKDVRGSKIKGLEMWSEQAGIPIDQTWLAAVKDPAYQDQFAALKEGIGSLGSAVAGDPAKGAMLADFYSKASSALGGQFAGEKLGQTIAAMATMNRIQTQVGIAEKQGETQTLQQAASRVDDLTKNVSFRMQNLSKAFGQIKAMESGKLKSTSQLLAQLQEELKAAETGQATATEGAKHRALYESYGMRLNNLVQEIKGAPQDSASPEFVKEIKENMQLMKKEFMENYDQLQGDVEQAYANAPYGRAARAMVADRFASNRKVFAERLGGWEGFRKEGLGKKGKLGGHGAVEEKAAPVKKAEEPAVAPEQLKAAGAMYEKYKTAAKNSPALASAMAKQLNQLPAAAKQKIGYKDVGSGPNAGDKPRVVIQNGHTYKLNEATGEYE